MSSVGSPRNSEHRCCEHTPPAPPARRSWPMTTARPRSSSCAKRSTSTTPLACATKQHVPDSSSPTRARHSVTTTRPKWSRVRPTPPSNHLARPRPEHRRHRGGVTARRSHPTRTRSARPARPRQDEPHDRHRTLHQREDRGQPREPHLHEARRRLPLRRDRLRLRPRSRLTIHARKAPADAWDSHREHSCVQLAHAGKRAFELRAALNSRTRAARSPIATKASRRWRQHVMKRSASVSSTSSRAAISCDGSSGSGHPVTKY